MPARPGPLGRILAHLQDEVAATALEGHRRAGSIVYELLDDLDHARLDARVRFGDGWHAPPATQAALLSGWCAFALQVLGDQLVAGDYAAEPRTVGFVRPEVAEQALAFYDQVPGWVSRTRLALADERYEIDVEVPVTLPAWRTPSVRHESLLVGLLFALDRLRSTADVLAAEVGGGAGERARAEGIIRALLADAQAGADFAIRLGVGSSPESNEETGRQARAALERYYVVGQLVAMPRLALEPLPRLQPGSRRRAGRPPLMPGPDEPGFDPWCLTDQRVAHVFRRDRKAVDALAGMWAFDPDPTRTLALRAEIDGALIRGDVAYGVGHWYACPWPPIYVTKRRVRLARAQLHPPEHFTYVLEFEGNPKRGRLRRRIVTGAFHPTRRVGYL